MNKLVKCEELEGFWNEIEIDSNNLISICQYNEEHVKNGKCYLYKSNSIFYPHDSERLKAFVIF